MEYLRFAVGERPCCVWGWNLREGNIRFINNVNPDYFRYIAKAQAAALEDEEYASNAAVLARLEYSHGIEALISLIFASLQAPACIVGWLHQYKVGDLRTLISKVQNSERIYNMADMESSSWETISSTVHRGLRLEDSEKTDEIKKKYAVLWGRFAREITDPTQSLEYNSIKHGFRACPGGFQLAIGMQDSPGVPAPPERMRSLGGSDFGSEFHSLERIGNYKNHYRIKSHSLNWRPKNFCVGLNLISLSMHNVLSFLRVLNGEKPDGVTYLYPSDLSHFDEPWVPVDGVRSFDVATNVPLEDVTPFDDKQILSVYKKKE